MHITIIGSRNVAWHLSHAFIQAGHIIDAIASRNILHASQLALSLPHVPAIVLQDIPSTSDLYLIAVTDSSIKQVAQEMGNVKGVVVHTSGASSISLLNRFDNHGVLYPCQTFTKGDTIDYNNLPFFIEGNNSDSMKTINNLAHSVSSMVESASSEQRTHLHISAVLASNFTNHLLYLAEQHMKNNNMNFEMLRPLVCQTVNKAFRYSPYEAQTGPARRHDVNTIEKHKELIADPTALNIYDVLTNSIEKSY